MGKREEQKKARRQQLLAIADSYVARYGYQDFSVDAITKEAGIAKGTFYNYFASKEELIGEIARFKFRPLNQTILQKASTDGALRALETYLLEFCQIIERDGQAHLQSWIAFSLQRPQLENKWLLDVQVLQEALEELDKQELLQSKYPQLLAQNLMAPIYGFMLAWSVGGIGSLTETCQTYLQQHLAQLLEETA